MANINIEKELFPEANTLKITDGSASAVIVDEELDLLECSFHNDLCVEINTSGYEYITLSLRNLKQLRKLILQAELYYQSEISE
jgi:hypothetical protein